jgi:palmitoyl-protein thioesterase
MSGFVDRFASLNKLVLVKAGDDTIVVPSETEWFGFYEDGSLDRVLSMNETVSKE